MGALGQLIDLYEKSQPKDEASEFKRKLNSIKAETLKKNKNKTF